MTTARWFGVCALAALLAGPTAAQTVSTQEAPVDFVRDVQPILASHCVECHGPDRQSNGLRLDRRRDALAGGTETVLVPGNAESSKLYLRLLAKYGEPMPKDNRLSDADIGTIKRWIDQGARWPDSASGEVAQPPTDPAVVRLVAALRNGDTRGAIRAVRARPAITGLRGPGNTPPLMFAALYGDDRVIEAMLDAGADVNAVNDAGATALMWAVTDPGRTRLLIDHGADVNAKSVDGRTPLLIASTVPGGLETLALLVDNGADVDVRAPGTIDKMSPLAGAAMNGDADMMAFLIERGVRVDREGPAALALAMRARCRQCVDMLVRDAPAAVLTAGLALSSPPFLTATETQMLLERGADAKAVDPFTGFNMLMLAAASDTAPADAAQALLARGVDVNGVGPDGMTALSLAMQHGSTRLVEALMKAGAHAPPAPSDSFPPAAPAASPRAAVRRSLPLLQKSDVSFMRNAGCVSCHNNSLAAMTTSLARAHALPVDANVASSQTQAVGRYVDNWRERNLQGHAIPGDADTVGYLLLGLAADGYPSDIATDAMARLLRLQQMRDGHWIIFAHRPPLESSDIEVTAVSAHALDLYSAPADRGLAQDSISRAAAWLKTAKPQTTEDRVFQLLGSKWLHVPEIRGAAARALIAEQRADGGWAQIPTLDSDAYATGQALVALAASGAIATSHPAYQRGVRFLLKTQRADGSWLVRTRTVRIQPLFDAGFPYGRNQFISAAATNWATQALILASGPAPKAKTASGQRLP